MKYCQRRGSNHCPLAWDLGTLPLDQLVNPNKLFHNIFWNFLLGPFLKQYHGQFLLSKVLKLLRIFQVILLRVSPKFQVDMYRGPYKQQHSLQALFNRRQTFCFRKLYDMVVCIRKLSRPCPGLLLAIACSVQQQVTPAWMAPSMFIIPIFMSV